MTAENTGISFAELCRSLVEEFAVALVTVKRSHPHVRVRSIKLNIGQTEEDIAPHEENGVEPATPLLAERYQGIEKGWQLQLEMGEQPSATFAGIERPLPSRTAATVLDFFAEQPLTVIDGISTSWERFFAAFGLTQLRHLARLEGPKLTEIMADGGNLRVREFRQKALLLKLPPPALPPSNLGEKSLYDLLHLPLDMVQKSFTRPVTRAEVAALYEMLDILNVVVDCRLLRQTPLHELLNGTGVAS